jgi:hypothetical protein
MKLRVIARRLEVTLHCRTWELAAGLAARNLEEPPEGYKMMGYQVHQRSKTGQRCNLRMDFLHVTRRDSPLTYVEACELFEEDKRIANGDQPLEEEPEEDSMIFVTATR